MKRVCVVLLSVVLLLLCSNALAVYGQYSEGYYNYNILPDNTIEITQYKGDAEVVDIPYSLNGMTVTTIQTNTFLDNSTIIEVRIPSCVRIIHGSAFNNCSNLVTVVFPDSMNLAESSDSGTSYAPFYKCHKLTDIRLSENNEVFELIDGVLFRKSDNMLVYYPSAFTASTYTIPDGTRIIGGIAFSNCKGLRKLNIPDSVVSLSFSCIDETHIEELTIPGSIKTIPSTFIVGTEIKTIILQEGVTTIKGYAFSSCTSLKTLYIPKSVSKIEDGGFYFSAKKGETPDIIVYEDSYAHQYCRKKLIRCVIYEDPPKYIENDISEIDLSSLSKAELEQLIIDIDLEIKTNHTPKEDISKKALEALQEKTEEYFHEQGIEISWAWYNSEYTYTRDWDFCTITTHIDYKDENGKNQKKTVYGEMFPEDNNGKKYKVFYLKIGDDVVKDIKKAIGTKRWIKLPDGVKNKATGYSLATLNLEQLNDLRLTADNEIQIHHVPEPMVSNLALALTKAETEQYFVNQNIEISWAWHDNEYKYTREWDFYTVSTHIDYKDKKGSVQEKVYCEISKNDDRYEVYYLQVGEMVILNKRGALPEQYRRIIKEQFINR